MNFKKIKEKITISSIIRLLVMGALIVLAFFCVKYGIRIKRLGYGTSFFIVWIMLGVIFLFLAWAVYKRLWKKIPKWLKITIITVTVLVLTCFLWVERCIISQLNAKGESDLDYIIVLGALVYVDGPSSILAARLNLSC